MYYFGVDFDFNEEVLDSWIKRLDGFSFIFKQVFVSYFHDAVIDKVWRYEISLG